jgi:hypothetical protein
MKKTALAGFAFLFVVAGSTYAAAPTPSPTSEIRESTDPAMAADVEKRAADMQARQQAAAQQDMSSGASGSKKKKSKKSKSSSSATGSEAPAK